MKWNGIELHVGDSVRLKNKRGDYWNGDGKMYARKRHNRAVPPDIVGKDFYYTWDDGWTACVSVQKVDAKEANKIMKKSVGFYGYDWMIDSIVKNKEIISI